MKIETKGKRIVMTLTPLEAKTLFALADEGRAGLLDGTSPESVAGHLTAREYRAGLRISDDLPMLSILADRLA